MRGKDQHGWRASTIPRAAIHEPQVLAASANPDVLSLKGLEGIG